MSAVSEGDVLAALVRRWAYEAGLDYLWHDAAPPHVRQVAIALRGMRELDEAIACSERRLAVESCEREVLDAVEEWDGSLGRFSDGSRIRAANAKLRRARMVLAHAR